MVTVLWLNDAFGVGKTTTARLVVARATGFRLYDPEWVGYLLRHHLPDVEVTDFQQYAAGGVWSPSWPTTS